MATRDNHCSIGRKKISSSSHHFCILAVLVAAQLHSVSLCFGVCPRLHCFRNRILISENRRPSLFSFPQTFYRPLAAALKHQPCSDRLLSCPFWGHGPPIPTPLRPCRRPGQPPVYRSSLTRPSPSPPRPKRRLSARANRPLLASWRPTVPKFPSVFNARPPN